MSWAREVDGLLLRLAAKRADRIRAAIVKSIDVGKAVEDWADHYPNGGQITPAMARDWARFNIPMDSRYLTLALEELHAEGWVLGEDVATAAFAHSKLDINKAAPSPEQLRIAYGYDWNKWKPGNRAAAALVRPPLGLQTLLAQGRASVKGMNTTLLNRVGTHLAMSLEAGEGYSSVQKKLLKDEILSGTIKSSSHALAISVTEMSRALNVSTLNSYAGFGVEQVEWLALDPCDRCSANAAQGPQPIGTPFSTGDTNPPAHPHCRCTLLPVIPGDTGVAPIEATPDMSISPVANHAIDDVMAGPASFKKTKWEDIAAIPAETDAEIKALQWYSGPYHKQINLLLRGAELSDPNNRYRLEPRLIDSLKDITVILQGMLKRVTVQENIKVHRYISREEIGLSSRVALSEAEGELQSLVGKTLENKSFLSTSAFDSEGKPLKTSFSRRPIRLELNLPAGTHAGRNAVSDFKDEQEVIIADGSKYVITNVYLDGEKAVVEALVVGE